MVFRRINQCLSLIVPVTDFNKKNNRNITPLKHNDRFWPLDGSNWSGLGSDFLNNFKDPDKKCTNKMDLKLKFNSQIVVIATADVIVY